MARSNVELTVNASQAQRALSQVNRQTTALTGAVNKLKSAFIGIGAAAVIRQTVKQSTSLEKLKLRLGLLTKENGNYEKSLKLVERAQKDFNLSQLEALEGITNITSRLAPLGVSLEDIETTFFGFNTAAKLAGASSMEATNAFRQLAQALGSGRLQGDEFRSISEQIPTLLAPIAEELGVTVGELKEYAAQGGLTSDKVIRALKKIEKDGGKSLKKLIENDPTAVFKKFQNQTELLATAVGSMLTPVLLPATQALTELVRVLTEFIESDMGKVVTISVALAAAIKALIVSMTFANTVIALFTTKLITTGAASILATAQVTGLTIAAKQLTTSTALATGAMVGLKAAMIKTGIGALIVAAGYLVHELIKIHAAHKKWKELIEEGTTNELTTEIENLNDKLKEQQEIIENGNGLWGHFLDFVLGIGTPTERAKGQIALLNAKIEQLNEALEKAKAKNIEEKIKKASNAMASLKEITSQTRAEFQETFSKKFGSYLKSVNDFGTQAATVIQNAFQGMEDAIVNFVQTGKLNFRDFANSIIADMIRIAVRQAIIAPLLKGFTNTFFPGTETIADVATKAKGGPVQGSKTYLVGEEGPEIFTPSVSGHIIPNNKISGTGSEVGQVGSATTITVNVDASGSEVEGDEENGRQLGEMLAAAIQSELIKQKRPGGLLTT